jgi:dephospho-CoA kinase
MIIGILGGIGSGKSTVARFFKDSGARVFSADPAVHQLLEKQDIKEKLCSELGIDLPDEPGPARKKLAGIVFQNRRERKKIEKLIHPFIEEKIKNFLKKKDSNREKIFILDVPLLLESDMDSYCDAFLFVAAPGALRLERIARERNWSRRELDSRQRQQHSLDKKRKKSSWIIDNSGSLENTKEQVQQIVKTLERTFSRRKM